MHVPCLKRDLCRLAQHILKKRPTTYPVHDKAFKAVNQYSSAKVARSSACRYIAAHHFLQDPMSWEGGFTVLLTHQ